MGSSEEMVFYKKGGRPRVLSKKEAHQAQLEAKRRWREKNKERVSAYNEMYRGGSKKKSKHHKKESRKGSKKSKHHKKESRKSSKHHKKESRKGSKSLQYGGHTVTLLKVNPDGSRIVLIR